MGCTPDSHCRDFAHPPAGRQADTELQNLIEAAGGEGSAYVFEQLDMDGDGTVTWQEFEIMLGEL